MSNLYIILLSAAGAVALLLIIFICMTISNNIKMKRILNHCKDGNLEQALTDYYNKLENTADDIRRIQQEYERYETDNQNAFQNVGIVHFDAFEDISGKMSFAVALLNRHNNGYILTSLYGHETSNVYIRNVRNGASETYLLDEEKEALRKAMTNAEG